MRSRAFPLNVCLLGQHSKEIKVSFVITIENILHTYTYNEHRESCIQHSCYIKVEWIQTIYTANILFKYFISVAAGHWLAAFRKAEEEKYKNLHQRIRKCQNRRAKCRTLDRAFLVSC